MSERLRSAPLLEILQRSVAWLERRGIESPRLDVELLMAHALGCRRLDLYLQFERPLDAAEIDRIRELITRRADAVPVAYLTGQHAFHALDFAVDDRVLVPRPETELLVDFAVPLLHDHDAPRLADVGTGSGCVAISVLHAVTSAHAYGTDVSAGALELAAQNAERHDVVDRLSLLEGSLLDPLRSTADWGRLDVVLANLPYIVRGDPSVAVGVHLHEPHAALYVGGDDPLALIRTTAEQAREALVDGGWLAVEVGHESGADAAALLESLGYTHVELRQDLAGIDRMAAGRRSG